ncbi:MAG TPA: DUF748 domain-containing protein, partial [Burkholderiales bacterium]|nr:DUF748 domain-containing protein [Burkholderiales bacterium]
MIEEIDVKSPKLRIVREEDSTYNISDIVEDLLKPASGPPARYALNNIRLQGGRIEFDDRLRHAKQTVTDLVLSIPFLSNLPYATDIYVKPVLSARVNGAPLHLAGQSKPFAPGRETSLRLDMKDVDIPSYLKYLPVPLKFGVRSAHLDAGLAIAFMEPPDQPPSVTLSGTATLTAVSLTQGDNAPLLAFPRLTVDIASADISRKTLILNRIALDHPELYLRREKG